MDEPSADVGARVRVRDPDIDSIQVDDGVGAKQRIEEQSNDAGHRVLRKHIHRVVDFDPVLDCPGESLVRV